MATTKTRVSRQETLVFPLLTVVLADAITTVTLDVPSGAYFVTFTVSANITGGSTTFAANQYVNAAQTEVVDDGIQLFQANNIGNPLAPVPGGGVPAGAIFFGIPGNQLSQPWIIDIPFGLEIVINKGSAVTGEFLELNIKLTRVMAGD